MGVTNAYLYGAPGSPGATAGSSSLNCFFLLLDRPEVYNLPVAPAPSAGPDRRRHLPGDSDDGGAGDRGRGRVPGRGARTMKRDDERRRYDGPTYYDLPPIKPGPYGWAIIVYFFIGGIASASQFIATIADLFGGRGDGKIVRAGRYLALAGAADQPGAADPRPTSQAEVAQYAPHLPEHVGHVGRRVGAVAVRRVHRGGRGRPVPRRPWAEVRAHPCAPRPDTRRDGGRRRRPVHRHADGRDRPRP